MVTVNYGPVFWMKAHLGEGRFCFNALLSFLPQHLHKTIIFLPECSLASRYFSFRNLHAVSSGLVHHVVLSFSTNTVLFYTIQALELIYSIPYNCVNIDPSVFILPPGGHQLHPHTAQAILSTAVMWVHRLHPQPPHSEVAKSVPKVSAEKRGLPRTGSAPDRSPASVFLCVLPTVEGSAEDSAPCTAFQQNTGA